MDWKTVEVRGEFRIDAPAFARCRMDDDETTFVVNLKDHDVDETEVLISRYPVGENIEQLARTAMLEERVRAFIEIAKQGQEAPEKIGSNVRTSYDADLNRYMSQGVLTMSKDRWWIVRGYTRDGWPDWYLVHWNGPKPYLEKMVVRIMESFNPSW